MPKPTNAQELIRLHEELLFQRAYPTDAGSLRKADEALLSFADCVAQFQGDVSAFEEPEVSGIAGTSFSAVFTYPIAHHLARRYPAHVRIDWDRYEKPERLAPVMARHVTMFTEDWPVEANIPYREWFGARDLAWLLRHTGQAEYDALDLPILWELGNSSATRSKMRLPARKIFYHDGPLIRRGDVSLAAELMSPPLPVTRLSRRQGEELLDLARDTSAVRYRELYGFTFGDPAHVLKADAGRGVEIYVIGVPPAKRLPLRAYHAGIFIKNGIPIGYVEALSLFERVEVGFNIYYTFREGESAWLYARTLRLFHQLCGATCFSVDPYQIGFHNREAIDSGAFWFYRKLGFRPVEPRLARLVKSEEKKIQTTPGYRTPARTLRRLAQGYLIFDGPGARPGEWDQFRARNLAWALERHTSKNPLALAPEVSAAKSGPDEFRYLRVMQRHPRLRAAILRLSETAH